MAKITKNLKSGSQQGVTLLLAILVLSSILAIAFSIATIIFAEVRNSSDLLKTEASIYGAQATAEEGIFKIKRQVPAGDCDSSTPNCYSPQVGNVSIVSATESSTSSPIQQIIVPASSNSFANTVNHYSLVNPDDPAGPSGFGHVKLTYLSPGNEPVYVYICQYDPQIIYNTIACTDPNDSSSPSYWLVPQQPINFSSPVLEKDLDLNMHQEIILVNGSVGSNLYVQIETFGAFDPVANAWPPKGMPYFGQTSIDINAKNSEIYRRVRVLVPNN
ncbi:MAG: hypothetical protein M1383_01735 [Patescibacteria group bacterium]|nr:hypothetical protein [Patescibacteria group bacterium]